MDEQKIRERLERYKKWRRDRGQLGYTGPPVFHCDVDWLMDELERQLERNTQALAMRELLVRWVEKFKDMPDVSYEMWLRDSVKAIDHHELFSLLTDTKTLLKAKDADADKN